MRWNWQQPDWPNFSYDASRLRSREDQFLKGAGVLLGAMTHLDADDRQNLSIATHARVKMWGKNITRNIVGRTSSTSSTPASGSPQDRQPAA